MKTKILSSLLWLCRILGGVGWTGDMEKTWKKKLLDQNLKSENQNSVHALVVLDFRRGWMDWGHGQGLAVSLLRRL